MSEYGISPTHIFLYKDRIVDFVIILGNTVQRKPVFSHILQSVRKNSFGSLTSILYSLNLPFSFFTKKFIQKLRQEKG